jgi:hypothetical protein
VGSRLWLWQRHGWVETGGRGALSGEVGSGKMGEMTDGVDDRWQCMEAAGRLDETAGPSTSAAGATCCDLMWTRVNIPAEQEQARG